MFESVSDVRMSDNVSHKLLTNQHGANDKFTTSLISTTHVRCETGEAASVITQDPIESMLY